MKMYILVETAKGFFAEVSLTVPTVQAGLNLVVPALEQLPDTIDGAQLMEWTKTTVEFTS